MVQSMSVSGRTMKSGKEPNTTRTVMSLPPIRKVAGNLPSAGEMFAVSHSGA